MRDLEASQARIDRQFRFAPGVPGRRQAYVAVGESAKAVAAALSLADKGVDTPQVNAVLISMTKLLMDDLKRLQAVQESPSTAGQPSSPGIVATSPVELRQKIGRLLAKLAPRSRTRSLE